MTQSGQPRKFHSIKAIYPEWEVIGGGERQLPSWYTKIEGPDDKAFAFYIRAHRLLDDTDLVRVYWAVNLPQTITHTLSCLSPGLPTYNWDTTCRSWKNLGKLELPEAQVEAERERIAGELPRLIPGFQLLVVL